MFRIGPSYEIGGRRVAFEGQQFPIEAFDQFGKQGVPRWVTNDAATQNAYDALVQKVCPCIVLVHSQGGNFGFNAALKAPEKVKALIAIEPSGAPDPAMADAAKLKGVPHLIVWGDYMDSHRGVAAPHAQSQQVGAGDSGSWRKGRYVRPAEDGHHRQHPHDDDGPELRRGRETRQRLACPAGPCQLTS